MSDHETGGFAGAGTGVVEGVSAGTTDAGTGATGAEKIAGTTEAGGGADGGADGGGADGGGGDCTETGGVETGGTGATEGASPPFVKKDRGLRGPTTGGGAGKGSAGADVSELADSGLPPKIDGTLPGGEAEGVADGAATKDGDTESLPLDDVPALASIGLERA